MAFIRTDYTRSSAQWNSGVFDGDSYASSTDALATIKASAYFNDIITQLAVGRWILMNGTDGSDIVRVTSVTTNVTVTSILGTLPPGSVELADLAAGISPSHVVKFGGTHTTVGTAAFEDITVTGALATDLASVVIRTVGSTPRTLLTSLAGTDKITITFSGDPSTDHVVVYQVLRVAA